MLRRALAFPDSIVASDALPVLWPDGVMESYDWPLPAGGSTHPPTAGCSRGHYARWSTKRRTWLEASRGCSQLPARVLDEVAPSARAKGHLGLGADADIVVLDPTSVTDMATPFDPIRPAQGAIFIRTKVALSCHVPGLSGHAENGTAWQPRASQVGWRRT